MAQQDVLNAFDRVRLSTTKLFDAMNVPMSTLQLYVTQTSAGAAQAMEALADLAALIGVPNPGDGGTGGTGGTGSNTLLARLKAVMATAPASFSAIQTTQTGTYVNPTIGDKINPIRIPGAGGAFVRHVIQAASQGGPGSTGFVDLLTVAKLAPLGGLGPAEAGPPEPGIVEFTSPSGNSRSKVWATSYYTGQSGSIAEFCMGFYHTGRAFGIANRINAYDALIYVNGVLRKGALHWIEGESYMYVDFGSSAKRSILVKGLGNWQGGEIAVGPTDTIEPYDFTADKFVFGWMGDSWGQSGENTLGMSLPSLISTLLGASNMVGSSIGGTGYNAAPSADQPNAKDQYRRAAWAVGKPEVMGCFMNVNDSVIDSAAEAAFTSAVSIVLSNARADCPDSVILVCPFVSQGSRATNKQGNEYKKRTIIKAAALATPGKVIFLDTYEGSWTTSDGTTKAVATGPVITGEGSAESPANDGGNADTLIDNNGGRHLTEAGVIYMGNWVAANTKEAIASMNASAGVTPGATLPLTDVILLGASLETGAFGFGIDAQGAEVIAAQNRVLSATGKTITIHQRAVSGHNTGNLEATQWPAALAAHGALPGTGKTLVIIGIGGNDVTPNVPITLPNQHMINQKAALERVIAQIEAKGWDWCLLDLSWRDYNPTACRTDRTKGSWQWVTSVSRPINAARKKDWGRTWTYSNGASWGDTYSLVRNNRQMLADPDPTHMTDAGYVKLRNEFVDSIIIPAITGTPKPQIFARDETYALAYSMGSLTPAATSVTAPTTASHQGTAYVGIYAAGSNPTAAQIIAGTGTGYVAKTIAVRDGTTIDTAVPVVVTGLITKTSYAVRTVFVSDAGQTSAILSGSVTTA